MQKSSLPIFICFLLSAVIVSSHVLNWAAAQGPNLSSAETQVIDMINGTKAYNYALELENIGLDHNLSGYSFRSSGSVGANASAEWIQEQFENLGLETHAEPFEFTTWNIMTPPILRVDLDGNQNTTSDQVLINSFQPEHFSWLTPEGGVYAQLVALPMPDVQDRASIQVARYDPTAWIALNTTGKVLLVGREIRMNSLLHTAFKNKLQQQPPLAVVFTWWYNWMSWAPPTFGSTGGRPTTKWGPYFWNQHIPVGEISYGEGEWIRNALINHTNISAQVIVNASVGQGPHYNIVGKLQGSTNPEKMIIISAHYDSVMTPAFCDNGAGVAGVLELARIFSEANQLNEYRPPLSLVFVAFAGEELGLVGSINYLKQHGSEMNNVVAVMNLDCIGSQLFQITETVTDDNGLNLQEIVTRAGQDLHVKVNYTDAESGASDQETFRAPSIAEAEYRFWWGSEAGIGNETRVKSSILISSIPLFLSDKWTDIGAPGWIHTPYDNSTSTYTLNWVSVDRLQAHTQVAGLSVMRVQSTISARALFLTQVYIGSAVAGIAAAVLLYVKRSKVYSGIRKLRHEILINFGVKELVGIIFLTGVYLFLSFAFFMRIGRDETVVQGFPRIVTYLYFGKPFEMIAIMSSGIGGGVGAGDGEAGQFILPDYTATTSISLPSFFLDALIFGLLAFITVYVIVNLTYFSRYSRSPDVTQEFKREEIEE